MPHQDDAAKGGSGEDAVDAFVRRVDAAWPERSLAQRRRLREDLTMHLRELPPEAFAVLGSPELYARELADTMDLPAPHRSGGGTRRRWVLVAAAVVVLLGASAALGWTWRGHGHTTASPVTRGERQVSVPTVIGAEQAGATRTLGTLGLHVLVSFRANPDAWGTIVSVRPATGSVVPAGSTVTLVVARPPGGFLLTAPLPATATPVLVMTVRQGRQTATLWAQNIVTRPTGAPSQVGTPPHPFIVNPFMSGLPSLCSQLWLGSGGSSSCDNPLISPRITWYGAGHWIAGVTTADAVTVRIHHHGNAPDTTAATAAVAQLPGVRFFLLYADNLFRIASVTGVDGSGRVVASRPT